MKGYMVVMLVCLASIQWIAAEPRRSSGGSSRSSGGSRYSGSSRSSGSYGGGRSGSYGGGSSRTSSNYGGGSSRSSVSYGGRGSSSTGRGSTSIGRGSTSIGSRSVQSGGSRYSQSSNHGYGNSYKGYGSSIHSGGKGQSFASKGYGTRWGTNFKNQGKHTGYSKKALGMGVAAGFVGGAVVGGAATAATYGVYHRYNRYRDLMYQRRYGSYGSVYHDDWGWGHDGWNPSYYNDYYRNNRCRYSCPYPAVCRYGFCECDYGYERRYGRCQRRGYDWSTYSVRRDFDPLSSTCINNEQCFDYDFNLICDTSLSTTTGRCKCRTDMRWNAEAYECQLYINVDCSEFTYDTKVSPEVEKYVQKIDTKLKNEPENDENVNLLFAGNETDSEILNETITIENTLKKSLLTELDPKDKSLTEKDITEAYCRDVDALSHEFQKGGAYGYNNRRGGMGVGSIVGIVIFVILAVSCCCLCAVCCACKGVLSCCKKKDRAPSPVAFSQVQSQDEMHTSSMNSGSNQPSAGYPAATQAYQPPNQPGYAPIYPPINQ